MPPDQQSPTNDSPSQASQNGGSVGSAKVIQPTGNVTVSEVQSIPAQQTVVSGQPEVSPSLSPPGAMPIVSQQNIYPQPGMSRTEIETMASSHSKKKLFKKLLIIVPTSLAILAAIAIGLLFASHALQNGLDSKTLSNNGYTYTFQFYKKAKMRSIQGTQLVSYKSGSVQELASVAPTSDSLRTRCTAATTDPSSTFREVFPVNIEGAEEPVCLTAGIVKDTAIQAFSVIFKAAGHNHIFIIIFYNDNQPSSSYPTLEKIFTSLQVS